MYNGTDTHLKIEVPYLETVSTSDPRLNARISKASRIEEADNITFSFEFREDDCDLEGLYECQFDMVEQFNTSFANLSVFVQGKLFFKLWVPCILSNVHFRIEIQTISLQGIYRF